MSGMTEERANEFYGKDAAEWLRRWDEGRTVWSVEMGGIGPGYEQAIQITCAETLRFMLAQHYDPADWNDKDKTRKINEEIREASHKNETISKLGLSGAQYGAATNLAGHIYFDGPAKCFQEEEVKDRLIQVRNTFPGA